MWKFHSRCSDFVCVNFKIGWDKCGKSEMDWLWVKLETVMTDVRCDGWWWVTWDEFEISICLSLLLVLLFFTDFDFLNKHGFAGIIIDSFMLAKHGMQWVFSLKNHHWGMSNSMAPMTPLKWGFLSRYQTCHKKNRDNISIKQWSLPLVVFHVHWLNTANFIFSWKVRW